ncbi:MAG: amidohydrolase [Lentisphaerae bacterium]|nr:amidohydrolase [Lentisphaerota bacterium]
MKIFDVHTHVFPEKIAAAALSHLQQKSYDIPVYTAGTGASLLQKASEAGYSGWLNCPVVTNPRQMRSVNDWAAEWNVWPHLSLGGIHPDAEDADRELYRIQELGLLGVKFHPEYQEFQPLEKRMERFWSICEKLSLPVLIHAGQDIGFQGSRRSRPADFAELSRRHPALVIICAHLGGWREWDEVERCLVGQRVFLDTSFAQMYMQDQTQFKRIIVNHGSEKILYGTDSPWRNLYDGVAEIVALGLSHDQQENIFWRNAERIFPLPKQ